MSMPGNRYQVFLSHSSRDKPFVRQVAARLRSEGLSYFLDEEHLVPGEPWQVALERALGDSDSCAVFIGDDGLGPYQTLEMRQALSQQIEANRGFRLIPVLLPGKNRPAERDIPAFLKQLTWVEFTAEPDEDDTAWRRLKAGVTGEAPGFVPAAKITAPADLAARKIIPRGLRSFEPEDHGFYLKLVPGPRDERGLPTVLRDWKRLVERIDPDRTFRVAYWYGPSGCGKSSLVKAGLIPALADYVAPVFVEASADDTEGRILRELGKVVETQPKDLGLVDSLRWIAQHPESLAGRKLLLVVDQFEQWLHAAQGPLDGDLASALRLCDGRQLQCLLLVRDEFKVPVHRLMKSLAIEQRENFNYALIDLLDEVFARVALFEYGRAYQRLPDRMTELSESQAKFLDRVISALRDKDGRVVSVQLALLAQMLEGQPWTPATLDQIGGAAGIGRAFLEEKFDKRSATAACELHRNAAIKVFEALLPETGTAIKGRSRSRTELLAVSGYAGRPKDFDELIQILDGELRVITPSYTDDVPCYQLTHDYLVPSLREWLTAKQRATWRGRAMLLLAERTAEWTAKPGIRTLPGPLEYMRIVSAVWLPTRRLGRSAQKPSPQQRRVLRLSTGWYGVIGGLLTALLAVLGWWRWELHGRDTARDLASQLNRTADAAEHRVLVDERLSKWRRWVVRELHQWVQTPPKGALLDLQRVEFGERRADEAIALVRLGAIDEALAAFRWRAHGDPEASTQFIYRAKERGVTCEQLVQLYERATATQDAEARFAALITLRTFSEADVDTDTRRAIADRIKLAEVYAHDPDSAIHSASKSLLRAWELPVPPLEPMVAPDERNWLVIRVPSSDAKQPSDATAPFDLTLLRIPRSTTPTERLEERDVGDADFPLTIEQEFWLSECEVTVGLFRRFHDEVKDPNSPYRRDPAVDFPTESTWEGENRDVSPSATRPVQQVSWEDAVLFCNWLSWRCQRKPRYHRSSAGWEPIAKCDGFRLPTELEWEYACRAGSVTQFGFGSDTRLLGEYAVYYEKDRTSGLPVGTKLPNAWGLFDMHGNMREWCQNKWSPNDPDRVVRGGSWFGRAWFCRSAIRDRDWAGYRGRYRGFRVCLVSGPVAVRPSTIKQ